MNLWRKALIYRVGSMLVGFIMNLIIFRKVEIAIGLTLLFMVTHTSYYYLFHRLWPYYGDES